ncbi:hypothetical protein PACTADRAFT_49747 [Pachysolen tannophilus NRRL Y-2460]|uniref:Uncharacterized protein n=1 Tax=Pachysolen tannophilus NRRL Y-2460 TaxID=669874 RepID=A0A1E4TXB5_PACTA|nr:hypothetical protein PACTADRAFT_49747 [Pachysolen tannophilus NRRL Y-2460]
MPIEATSDKSASKQENYSIDVCSNFPTKDQFQFILSAVKHNEKLRNPFQIAFPKWGKDLNQLSKSFNGENYDDILSRESGGVAGNSSEVVNKLIESGVYNPPLFVDWDNSLIAVDEKHLNEIIAKHTQT